MIKWILIISIILTIIYMVVVFYDIDRKITLAMTSMKSLIDTYEKKSRPEKRVVAILNCVGAGVGVCNRTLKSILDQSVKLHDIAVHTDHPENIDPSLRDVITIHKPNTEFIREGERDTLILYLDNNIEYPYDYVETEFKRWLS